MYKISYFFKKYIFYNKQNKETSWAILAKGIFIISGFFFLYFIPNFFGASAFGKFSLLFSYIYLTQIFFGSVFIGGAKKEITEHKFDNESFSFFLESLKATTLIYIISSILLIPIVHYFNIAIIRDFFYIFILLQGATLYWNTISRVFEYTHRLFYIAVIYSIEYSVKIALLVYFYYTGQLNFLFLMISFILGYALSAFVGFLILIKKFEIYNLRHFLTSNASVLKKIINRSSYLGISTISVMILAKIDTIMIAEIRSLADVGIYTVAAELGKKGSFITVPVILGVIPLFAQKINTKALFKSTLIKIFVINLIIFIAILLFGKIVISTLYGNEFLSAVTVLYILGIIPMLISFQTFGQSILILKDAISSVLFFSLISAIINIILNYLLISALGIIGAAIATVFSYTIWNALIFLELKIKVRIN